ncbi:MAG: hypothetical protein FJ299_01330 [Planctomycetes bacterium]|nr:hypothetical protein [Planctomycetota bacterium]
MSPLHRLIPLLVLTVPISIHGQAPVVPGSASQGAGTASPLKHEFAGQSPWFSGVFGGHGYVLLKLPTTWAKAELFAQVNFNAHLVVVNSPQEHFFLYSTFCGTLADSRDLWIGMTDRFVEGNWKWVTGEPITYTSWGPFEPNNYSGFTPAGEDFAQFMGPGSYVPSTWNDMSPWDTIYQQPIHGVIELPLAPASVPNPISLTTGGMHVLPIVAPAELAGHEYLVIGSVSGTRPGLDLGGVHLPLNLDAYTLATLSNPDDGLIRAGRGQLDQLGEALAAFQVPPGLPANLVGLQVHHCAVVHSQGQIEYVTVPLTATLMP